MYYSRKDAKIAKKNHIILILFADFAALRETKVNVLRQLCKRRSLGVIVIKFS